MSALIVLENGRSCRSGPVQSRVRSVRDRRARCVACRIRSVRDRLNCLSAHTACGSTAQHRRQGPRANRGRTSKPCDTSRRVHSQANAYSTGRCFGALRARTHTHTHETRGKAIRHVSPSSTHGTLPPGRSQGLILQYRCAWESYAVGGPLTPLEYTFGSRHALHSASVRACTAFPKRLRSLNISAICVSPTARSQSHVMFGS